MEIREETFKQFKKDAEVLIGQDLFAIKGGNQQSCACCYSSRNGGGDMKVEQKGSGDD